LKLRHLTYSCIYMIILILLFTLIIFLIYRRKKIVIILFRIRFIYNSLKKVSTTILTIDKRFTSLVQLICNFILLIKSLIHIAIRNIHKCSYTKKWCIFLNPFIILSILIFLLFLLMSRYEINLSLLILSYFRITSI
jgi:hypothetical protein